MERENISKEYKKLTQNTEMLLKAVQALLQINTTPKPIPKGKVLPNDAWDSIDKKRGEYLKEIIKQIDILGEK